MTLQAALRAVYDGDKAALVRYTRHVVRLFPAFCWWPYIAQALWETDGVVQQMQNPSAYLRETATRLRRQAEASLFGNQPVLDRCRRVIGTVQVGGRWRDDGTLDEALFEQACDIPLTTPRPAPRHIQPVETLDDDERRVRALQMAGKSRREIADVLGWTLLEVERISDRLYRRRHAASRRVQTCTMYRGKNAS